MSTTEKKPGRARLLVTTLGQLQVIDHGGPGQPLVLWPSIFTDHAIFDGLVARLGQRFRFVLVDGPWHGGSQGPAQRFTMADCGRAMGDLIDQLALDHPVVGGTSWGGLAAAELALQRPERLKALVLMNTPMTIDGDRPARSARMITLGARWMLGLALFRNGVAKSFFTPSRLDANPGFARHFHQMLQQASAKRLAMAVGSVILAGKPLINRLDQITLPTLVIAGEQDSMYPLEQQAEAALRLPRGRFQPVPGKHISVIDAPDAVEAALLGFLS